MHRVTRQQHESAQYAADRLKKVAEALTALDDQSLSYDVAAIQTRDEFCDFLSAKLQEAGRVIALAKRQYEDRDQALICAASTRFFAIDNAIDVARATQSALISGYRTKVDELTKKQFSPQEIAKIVVDPTEEVAALDGAIRRLQAEKSQIQRFLSDAPRYDENLLAGTGVFEVRKTQMALKTLVVK
jgi:hypothetical protein